MRKFFKSLVKFYQLFLSPFLGGHCRFYPSCSVYAEQALEKYPLRQSLGLILKRLLKCQPFHPGGSDRLDNV